MSGAGSPIIFETRHRVRFRDVDLYGHMNMVHYLAYYTDHRFEGMRVFIGLDLQQITALPIAFHTRSIEIQYVRPLLLDQEFLIRSFVTEMGRGSCQVDLTMVDDTGQTISTGRLRVACVDKATGRPCSWPPGLMERFFK